MHVVAAPGALQACRQGSWTAGHTTKCRSIADRAGQPPHLRLAQSVCIANVDFDMLQPAGRQARPFLCRAAVRWRSVLAALSSSEICTDKPAA